MCIVQGIINSTLLSHREKSECCIAFVSTSMAVVRVYIVRHGETDENRLGIMQGQVDTKLNAAGIEQAQLAASALEVVPFKRAHSSDLERATKVCFTARNKRASNALIGLLDTPDC